MEIKLKAEVLGIKHVNSKRGGLPFTVYRMLVDLPSGERDMAEALVQGHVKVPEQRNGIAVFNLGFGRSQNGQHLELRMREFTPIVAPAQRAA